MLALSGVVGFQFVVYQGLHSTTAINGVLIIATIPTVIPAFAYALDGERITPRQGLGIVVSTLGVAIIVLRGDPAAALALDVAAGDLWIASAVPMWALYSVLVRRRPEALSLALLLAIVGIGLAVLVPASVWELAAVGGFAPGPAALAAIIYVGIVASVLAFWCWNRGIAGVGASKAGLYLHLMPVFAALLAVPRRAAAGLPWHGDGLRCRRTLPVVDRRRGAAVKDAPSIIFKAFAAAVCAAIVPPLSIVLLWAVLSSHPMRFFAEMGAGGLVGFVASQQRFFLPVVLVGLAAHAVLACLHRCHPMLYVLAFYCSGAVVYAVGAVPQLAAFTLDPPVRPHARLRCASVGGPWPAGRARLLADRRPAVAPAAVSVPARPTR